MKLIDGKQVASKIHKDIQAEIQKLSERAPGLAFILIGNDPASKAYVRMKKKGCEEVGIHSEILKLPEDTSQKALLCEIKRLNSDPHIDGILVQQPLPKHLSTSEIVEAVDPAKDVDGFHPMNIGRLLLGEEGGFAACTPLGIMKLLKESQVNLEGIQAVIIGRSNIVGKPLAALLMQKGADATVTVAHSKTKNLNEICKSADLVIAAIGRPHFVTSNMVKPGAIVIDVGINRVENSLVGDVDFESVKEIASLVTPVPGGVGPMTIAMLLSNTLESYKRKHT